MGNSIFGKTVTSDQSDLGSMFSSDLKSYASACANDPDLKSFDSTLYKQTNHMISSLAAGVNQDQPLSFGSLIHVTGSLLDLNQEVVRHIIQSKEDIFNNKDLYSLVNVYFEGSLKILEFCNAVDFGVRRAKISQMIIQLAIKQFEKEKEETKVAGNKYLKTLEELKKFKAAGHPFKDDFFNLYKSVYDQQILLLKQLHKQKRKLDKKLKNMPHWRRLSNVVFVTAFVAVLVLSVVAAAMGMPLVVSEVAVVLASPIKSMGEWCSSSWKEYEKALKRQKHIVMWMSLGTISARIGMEDIHVLADKLKDQIDAVMMKADIAFEKEDDVEMKLVMDGISKELDVFMKGIDEIGHHAAMCSHNILLARTVVLRHIMAYPPS